jgi:dipeptidyl aminopeptidase/acylaminoacyl peptidase
VEPRPEPFDIPGARGERVRGEVRLPAGGGGPVPVVVIAHGFKAFRRWGFFPWLSERLAARGFASALFDFSHNGTDAAGDAYPRKDLFRAATWGTHQEDLAAVVAAVRAGGLPGAARIDPARLALLGHSLGGGLSVLLASRDRGVRCVVGLAPVNRADRFSPAEKAAWRRKGELGIVNTRTGETLPLGLGWLEDAEGRAAELDVAAAAARLACPLLVVHGDADTSVPPEEGRSLVEAAIAAGRPARFALLPGTQHTFDAIHPFAGPTPALDAAWSEVAGFLDSFLLRFDPAETAARKGWR